MTQQVSIYNLRLGSLACRDLTRCRGRSMDGEWGYLILRFTNMPHFTVILYWTWWLVFQRCLEHVNGTVCLPLYTPCVTNYDGSAIAFQCTIWRVFLCALSHVETTVCLSIRNATRGHRSVNHVTSPWANNVNVHVASSPTSRPLDFNATSNLVFSVILPPHYAAALCIVYAHVSPPSTVPPLHFKAENDAIYSCVLENFYHCDRLTSKTLELLH